jgi:hypothetical protein
MTTRLYSHLLGSPEDHVMSLNTIVTREPMMQYIIDLLNNLCLKKGVRISIAFTKPEKAFHEFFEQYFVSILPNVLRYKMYCGFLPWVVVQHPNTGDMMPVLLPIGSFSWHIRTKTRFTCSDTQNTGHDYNKYGGVDGATGGGNSLNKARKKGISFTRDHTSTKNGEEQCNVNLDHNCATEYVVECSGGMGVQMNEINVINLIDPMLLNNLSTSTGNNRGGGGKNNNSFLGQAQYSPLYVALQKYLALDLAQQRRCYADDWNTTARLFTTKTPPAVQNERAGRDEIPYGTTRFQQAQMPEGFFTYDNMKLQYQNTSNIVRDALEQSGGRGSEHVPSVYSLPAHYNLVQQPELKPLMDIEMLERQYRSSIAHSLGMPIHLIDSESGSSNNMSNDDLPFMSEMVKNTCESLTTLMGKVLLHLYSTVYHKKSSKRQGPEPASTVRFMFDPEELYSENIKDREDEKVKLQKTVVNNGGSGSRATGKK